MLATEKVAKADRSPLALEPIVFRHLAAGRETTALLRPAVRRYAALFNARDWDAVRAMLIDDVRLEVVEATSRRGRKEVGIYFHNYDGRSNWYMVAARLEDREGLAVLASADSARPNNFIELTVCGNRIACIRDFHHVPYLIADAHIVQVRSIVS